MSQRTEHTSHLYWAIDDVMKDPQAVQQEISQKFRGLENTVHSPKVTSEILVPRPAFNGMEKQENSPLIAIYGKLRVPSRTTVKIHDEAERSFFFTPSGVMYGFVGDIDEHVHAFLAEKLHVEDKRIVLPNLLRIGYNGTVNNQGAYTVLIGR
jgi:hypothetical protein